MAGRAIVSMLWIQTLARFVEHLGTDPGPLLARFNLSAESVERTDEWLPYATFLGLQEIAAEAVGDPHFGLRMGLAYEPSHSGPLGYAMVNANSVRESMKMIIRYQAMHMRGVALHLRETDDVAIWSYHLDSDELLPEFQDSYAAIGTGLSMVRCLGYPDWSPTKIYSQHAPRDCDDELEELVGASVVFSQARNALVFPRALLEQPVQGADSGLGSVLERHLTLLSRRPPKMSEGQDTLVAKVREAVAAELHDGEPGLERVARSCSMSGRTLQRELRKRTTAFRKVVEEVRRDLALEYMSESDTAMTQIAFMLGYSELSAFDRAFRRWTGKSPQAHRRELSQ